MWPKALMQLLELAPHVTRLVPAADRYLQSRAEGRDTQRAALEQVAEGLRGDLTQLAAGQAGISDLLKTQSEAVEGMAAELRAARLSAAEMEARVTRMEARTSQLWMGLLAALVLIVVVGLLVLVAVLRMRQYVHGS